MKHCYGEFSEEQFQQYITQLHKKIHWLLLYKDPNLIGVIPDTSDESFNKYFKNTMFEISGLNSLLFYPPEICTIMCLLQAAWLSTQHDEFDFKAYRKSILDVHNMIDAIGQQGGGKDA